ncbi:MAG: amidohydrolase family protein [Actinomycetota bacterium]|nr:amidohydrolase family protein [Actinomycetota bacterium]
MSRDVAAADVEGGLSLEDMQRRSLELRPPAGKITLLPDPDPAEVWATIVSVDGHVVEPPDMFEGRAEARYRDQMPRVVETADGSQSWLWNGQLLPNVGLNAVAGRPPEEHTSEPTRFEHMRRGAWDPHARLADMDINGVWASLCFPSFLAGFVGQRLTLWPHDAGLALAAMRAYNDWHLESWCGADRDRMIPQQIAWLRDPELAAAEIRRNAARGFKAVTFSEAPHKLGLPTIHSGYWDPFVEACAETGTVLCLHVGSAGQTVTTSEDAPIRVVGALFAASAFASTADWLCSGYPARHPQLRIVMSEGGIGWVGGLVDRLDHLDARHAPIAMGPGLDRTSDLLRRNFRFCALDDPSGFLTRDVIGVDNILVEADYPHSDSTWPHTQALLEYQLRNLSVAEQRRICWKNAVDLFRHCDPPAPLP